MQIELLDPPDDPGFRAYEQAFHAWRDAMRRRGDITADQGWAVYEDMWLAFARACTQPGTAVALADVRLSDLERFIHSRGSRSGQAPTPRYVWRLLHLIDRVLGHAARAQQRPPPTAPMELLASRREWQYANARRGDAIDYLAPAPARALVQHLSQARPRPGRDGEDGPWQQVRNRAAVALHLGAGLTPGEVRELTLSAVVADGGRPAGLPWKLRIAASGDGPAREAPVAAWAGQLLRHWLTRRTALAIAGPWLFPATRTGKPWSKPAQYVALCDVLAQAGWPPEQVKGGAFRLRHTFALRQLRKGFDERQVAQWLGVEPDAMGRYRGILLEPVLDMA